jgi:hypothetical protein
MRSWWSSANRRRLSVGAWRRPLSDVFERPTLVIRKCIGRLCGAWSCSRLRDSSPFPLLRKGALFPQGSFCIGCAAETLNSLLGE